MEKKTMKRNVEEDSSDSNSSAISEFSEEEEIDVDFDFLNPAEIDFYGLKALVKDLVQLEDSGLVDYLISMDWGTVVKIDDQKDPFSIFTLLDLSDARAKLVLELLKSKSGDKIDYSKHVGVLFSDRLINMPPQIAPPCWDLLNTEIKARVKDKVLQKFDYYIYISKIYFACGKETKRRKQNVNYFQAEDEFIAPLAASYFDYELDNQQVSDSRRVFSEEGIEHARRVFVIKADKLDLVVKSLQKNVI